MESHQGLELAQYLANSPNRLESLQAYAHPLVMKTTLDDPMYKEIVKLQEGVLEDFNDRQAYFRYCYRHAIQNTGDNPIPEQGGNNPLEGGSQDTE